MTKIAETRPLDGHTSNFRKSPLRELRAMFVNFVQGLFAGAPPGEYRWVDDDDNTELVITNEMKIDPEVIMRRPGISFTRGPAQFYSLGIDDLMEYDMDIERKTKSALVPGTMNINCISRVMLECEDIAWWVAEYIWILRDLIIAQGLFDVGRTPQIGAPSAAGSLVANDQGDEFTVVAVSVPWQFARTSSYTPLGKRIVGGIELVQSTSRAPMGMRLQRVEARGGPAYVPSGMQPNYPWVVRRDQASPPFGSRDVRGMTPDPAGIRGGGLPKQPSPYDPTAVTTVRIVQPSKPGQALPQSSALVPISDPAVKES